MSLFVFPCPGILVMKLHPHPPPPSTLHHKLSPPLSDGAGRCHSNWGKIFSMACSFFSIFVLHGDFWILLTVLFLSCSFSSSFNHSGFKSNREADIIMFKLTFLLRVHAMIMTVAASAVLNLFVLFNPTISIIHTNINKWAHNRAHLSWAEKKKKNWWRWAKQKCFSLVFFPSVSFSLALSLTLRNC